MKRKLWTLGLAMGLDGTFLKEVFIKRDTLQSEGTVHDFAFSPDAEQRFLYFVDGSNKWVRILNRQTLQIVDSVGGHAGHGAQEFFHIHSVGGADSKGNIYLGEVNQGQRYMRYSFTGMGAPANPNTATARCESITGTCRSRFSWPHRPPVLAGKMPGCNGFGRASTRLGHLYIANRGTPD
jgi:hypothetical protein